MDEKLKEYQIRNVYEIIERIKVSEIEFQRALYVGEVLGVLGVLRSAKLIDDDEFHRLYGLACSASSSVSFSEDEV